MQWNANHSFQGGGTVANVENDSTTIQARVIEVESNGVLRVAATRLSKAGDEDTRMVLTGLVRTEDPQHRQFDQLEPCRRSPDRAEGQGHPHRQPETRLADQDL